jgi:hypothetical protein
MGHASEYPSTEQPAMTLLWPGIRSASDWRAGVEAVARIDSTEPLDSVRWLDSRAGLATRLLGILRRATTPIDRKALGRSSRAGA